MPPARDDDRNARQIEALRRYVAELGTNRERPQGTTGHEQDEERPPARGTPSLLPWLALTVVLVVGALVGGVLIGAAREDRKGTTVGGPSVAAPTTTLTAPVASPECRTAVDRANLGLAAAVKLRGLLGEYAKVMDDLRNGRINGRKAAEQATPYLAQGTVESDNFNRALDDYTKVVDKCKLREP